MLGKLRIIGGKWRGRKLSFVDVSGLRPTSDRVRETVFNWLAPFIEGAICLDLFAGSGALGFEALSRGAKHVVMVDQSYRVIEKLKANAELLGAINVDFYCLKMPRSLVKLSEYKFGIIFLDPPFHKNLLAPTCKKLEEINCLTKDVLIYIEAENSLNLEKILPENWKILKKKKAGQVRYCLLRKSK